YSFHGEVEINAVDGHVGFSAYGTPVVIDQKLLDSYRIRVCESPDTVREVYLLEFWHLETSEVLVSYRPCPIVYIESDGHPPKLDAPWFSDLYCHRFFRPHSNAIAWVPHSMGTYRL